ncbi:MAG: hypothetical protein ACYTFT_11170, partial [Planctomycetota bacterium]
RAAGRAGVSRVRADARAGHGLRAPGDGSGPHGHPGTEPENSETQGELHVARFDRVRRELDPDGMLLPPPVERLIPARTLALEPA